ncbi:surfeit locus protein 1-like isoform X2 [Salvia splendens]|uniref:surfeit locus protein 1-like isoform X2 n=1 Tax=Salvia splendens TaxID=180675 RepID=UPI001C270FF5|nr:surfeit locus protein 1-like isoform X2 [Salvia splendens]
MLGNHQRLQQIRRRAATMTMATSTQTEGKKKSSWWSKIKIFWVPSFLLFKGTELLFSLPEKPELVESRLKMEAIEINDECLSLKKNLEFRKIKMKGFFDEKKSILVVEETYTDSDPFAYEYSLLTPFLFLPQNSASVSSGVLVNRGRVPREWADYTKIEKLQSHEIVRDFPQKGKLSSIGVVNNNTRNILKWLLFSAISRPQPQPQPQPQPIEFVGVIRGRERLGVLAGAMGLHPEATLYVEQIQDKSAHLANTTLYNDAHMLAHYANIRKDHIHMIILWYCSSAGMFQLGRWLMKNL